MTVQVLRSGRLSRRQWAARINAKWQGGEAHMLQTIFDVADDLVEAKDSRAAADLD